MKYFLAYYPGDPYQIWYDNTDLEGLLISQANLPKKLRQRDLKKHYGIERGLKLMMDSGGFQYVESEFNELPSMESIMDIYMMNNPDIVASLDWPIYPQLKDWQINQRLDVTKANARIMMELKTDYPEKYNFEIMAVTQGKTADQHKELAKEFYQLGFLRIGIGGLVPLSMFSIQRNLDKIYRIVSAVRSVSDDFKIHLFGIGNITVLNQDAVRNAIDSFDNTTPIRVATKGNEIIYSDPYTKVKPRYGNIRFCNCYSCSNDYDIVKDKWHRAVHNLHHLSREIQGYVSPQTSLEGHF